MRRILPGIGAGGSCRVGWMIRLDDRTENTLSFGDDEEAYLHTAMQDLRCRAKHPYQ